MRKNVALLEAEVQYLRDALAEAAAEHVRWQDYVSSHYVWAQNISVFLREPTDEHLDWLLPEGLSIGHFRSYSRGIDE